MNIEFLSGHTSAETAYVVDDYPYGFRLRCKIRYWLEYKPNVGMRFVSQTTNPKQSGEVWNKPKASTYTKGAVVLYRDLADGHIHRAEINYRDATESQARDFLIAHETRIPVAVAEGLKRFIAVKQEYERLKATGMDYHEAALRATRLVMESELQKENLK